MNRRLFLVTCCMLILSGGAYAAPNVYVDDDWVGTLNGASVTTPDNITVTFGTDAFATITEGVAAVDAGGTVKVYGGTYGEGDIFIDRSMNVIGDAGDREVAGPGSNAPTIDRSAAANPDDHNVGFGIVPGVSGVTIEGFNIINFDKTGVCCPRSQAIHIAYDPSVFAPMSISNVGYSDINIRYNSMSNIAWAGVFGFTDGSNYIENISIQYNVVEHDNWDFNDNLYGLECTNCIGADISHNVISGGFNGIVVSSQANPSDVSSIGPYNISNNTVSDTVSHNIVVTGFTLDNAQVDNTEINQIQIENNTINVNFSASFGYEFWGKGIGLVPFGGGSIEGAQINGNKFTVDTTDLSSDATANFYTYAAGFAVVKAEKVAGNSFFTNNTIEITGDGSDRWVRGFEIYSDQSIVQNWEISGNRFLGNGLGNNASDEGAGLWFETVYANGSEFSVDNNEFIDNPIAVGLGAGFNANDVVTTGRDNIFQSADPSHVGFDVTSGLGGAIFDFNRNYFDLAGDVVNPVPSTPDVVRQFKSSRAYSLFDALTNMEVVTLFPVGGSENWTITLEDYLSGQTVGTLTNVGGTETFTPGVAGTGGAVFLRVSSASPSSAPTFDLGDFVRIEFDGTSYDIFLPPSNVVDYSNGVNFWVGTNGETYFSCDDTNRACTPSDMNFVDNLNTVFVSQRNDFIAQEVSEYAVALTETLGSDFNYLGVPAPNSSLNLASELYNELNDQFGGTVVRTIAKWNAISQSSSNYVQFPFETGNFTVLPGDVYRVEVSGDLFAQFRGAVPASGTQAFDFITTNSTSINYFTVPLFKTDVENAAELSDDITANVGFNPVSALSRWNRTSQSFVQYLPVLSTGSFDVNPGDAIRADVAFDATYVPQNPQP